MENQLGTRNMVKAVTEEFWRMVQASIHDQTLKFKGALSAHTNTARAHTHRHTVSCCPCSPPLPSGGGVAQQVPRGACPGPQ